MISVALKESITAVVLAGGRGTRMGGVDKGLQMFDGTPLAQHALHRLLPQVGSVIINANRNIAAYKAFGVPVWPDDNSLGEFAGPLAGVVTALQHCTTPYLLTVPCDAPLFPSDLVARLAAGLTAENADFAVVSAPESGDTRAICRLQPVFSLMKASLVKGLIEYTKGGGRKVSSWMDQHRVAPVQFDEPQDAHDAFFNANTLAQLQQLQNNKK